MACYRRTLQALALLIAAASAAATTARIFSADDKLHVRGDGVIVTAPRVDIEGDLFFTAPAEGQTKLQDMPATLTQARQDIDAVTAQASALQAFHDAHFAASADPNTLTIMPAAPDTDADGDEDKADTLLTLQASDIVLQGQVKIADPDNSGAEPQTLNDLPARFTQIESTVSDVSGEVDTLRSEQQKWHDTYFATDESDGLKVMAGTEDGSLTLKGNEINLDGSTQVRGTDGSYRPIGDVPQAVSENTASIKELLATVAELKEALRDVSTRCGNGQYELMPLTATSDRVCRSVTVCPSGQYEIVAPTATSDRKCDRHATCAPGTYEAEHPTPVSNRVCRAWTTCGEDEYELAAPTPYEDRVCRAVVPCDADAYEAQAATPTSAAICIDYTVCDPATQLEAEAPTASSDRVCAAKNVECTADEYEVSPPTATRPRVCAEISECSSTEYEAAAPTADSDRDCKKLTECEEGKSYESTAATVTSDRECTALTVCKEGEEETEAPTPTSDRKCRDPNASGCSDFSIHSYRLSDRLWICSDGAVSNKNWDRVSRVCNLDGGYKLVSVRPMTAVGRPDANTYENVRQQLVQLNHDYLITGQPTRRCSWNDYQTGFTCNGLGYIDLRSPMSTDSNWNALVDGNDNELRGWPAANSPSAHRLPSLCGDFGDVSDNQGPMKSFADGRIWR